MKRAHSKRSHPAGIRQRLAALWLALVIVLTGLFLVTGCAPQPPVINTAGLDPAVVQMIDATLRDVKQAPRSGETWGRLGSVLMHYEFPAETSVAFARAERLAPGDPRWPHLHGLALSATDLADATEKFRRAASLAAPEFDAPALHLAESLAERGFSADAEVGFTTLLRRTPQHAPALLGLARLRLAAGRAQDATNLLAVCLRDAHTTRAAHTLMATARQALGDAPAAKSFAATAATLRADAPWPDPWWSAALQFRVGRKAMLENATSLLDQGKTSEAVTLLDQAAREYPADAEVWYLAGWAMVRQQRPVEGERALREHLRLAPQSPKGHAQFAVALLMQRRHAEAVDILRAGVALKPTWREFHSNLGFACVQLGREAEALAHYREALALDPNHLPTHTALAELLVRRGDHAQARQLLRQALEIDPTDSRAREMLERAGAAR